MNKQIFIKLNQIKEQPLAFNKPGNYLVYFENLSGKFEFIIKEKDVNLEIYGVYHGKNKDQFHVETIQHHLSPQSTSNLLIKGVFDNQCQFLYRGLIRIEKEAQKSHAYQKNQNLLLSPEVFVDSKPELEILANDVFCTHGSTTGYLNQEELYYLQTRGLTKKQAEKLIVNGFLSEIRSKIHLINTKQNVVFVNPGRISNKTQKSFIRDNKINSK